MRGTHELVQTLSGTETSRSHANDENVNIAVVVRSADRRDSAIVASGWVAGNIGGRDSHVRHGGGLKQGRCLKERKCKSA